MDISVGFAELEPGDTADGMTARADTAMRAVKAAHGSAHHRKRGAGQAHST